MQITQELQRIRGVCFVFLIVHPRQSSNNNCLIHMTAKKRPLCFRGLDIGFGHTKFTKSNFSHDGTVSVGSFPSYAANGADGAQLGDNVFQEISVIPVMVGSEKFLVGEDVRKTADGAARQILESDFYKSNQYKALALGALAMMNVPEDGIVDVLVIGLPINVMGDQLIRQGVMDFLQKTHSDLPSFEGQGQTRSITVRKVHLIPQVAGTLLALADEKDLTEAVESQINLTIDVGYGTLLWLVTEGYAPLRARCGGNMGGVSSVLQKVLRAIDSEAAQNLNIMDRLDKALRDGSQTIKVSGQNISIAPYKQHLDSAVQENLTELKRSVGQTQDIDNIFLTGGGAHLYAEAIRAAFPTREILSATGPSRFSNVRGFQLYAEDLEATE